jgi:hypothetical protein
MKSRTINKKNPNEVIRCRTKPKKEEKLNPIVIVKVTDEKGNTYTTDAKDGTQIHALHFNKNGEIFCVELLNGRWITHDFIIEFENYFASEHLDCAKHLTDNEFETLQGLHKKVALLKERKK